nr:MAG TPA: Putative Holin-like Toxin (Hol-Tox) [Caudoviricetes sp.]
MMLMSTYEEFQIIISVAILIVAILNYIKNDHKK